MPLSADKSFNVTASDGSTANLHVTIAGPAEQPAPPHTGYAELPLDEVPEPGRLLPPGSRMPWRPNADFIGRRDELRQLARALAAGQGTVIGQSSVITGSGGFGKTQLATEAVWRYGRYFPGGAFWLSFETADGIPGEIARCGDLLGLCGDYARLPPEEQVRLVLTAWQDGRPRLVVCDNCEDPELFRRWIPRLGPQAFIVTSRCDSWPGDLSMAAMPLRTLPRRESMALLRRQRPDLAEDDADLCAIAAELGDLPLALHLAGAYLHRYRAIDAGQPAAYLRALRRADPLAHASLTGGHTPTGHDANVAQTFALSSDRLDSAETADALALRALRHATRFAPGEAIPRWLLASALGLDWSEDAAQIALADALARLGELGLIDNDQTGPSLHRLIAAFAHAGDPDATTTAEAVELAVDKAAAAQNRTGLPLPLLVWQSHLRAVAESAAEAGRDRAGGLLNILGTHLRMIGDYDGARAAFERALIIDEKAFGLEHPTVATRVNNLGSVLLELNDLNGARAAFERALVIDEKALGPNHPNVAIRVNNLGRVLQDLGDFDGARAAFERALVIDEKAFGPDHRRISTRVNNLGDVLREQGDLDGARAAFKQAQAIDEKAFGPDHPRVATDVNNLGRVQWERGDFDGARAAFERALAIDEKALGPDHPNVATRLNNLGYVLWAQGDYDGARRALLRALSILETRLGLDHPHTQRVRNTLAAWGEG